LQQFGGLINTLGLVLDNENRTASWPTQKSVSIYYYIHFCRPKAMTSEDEKNHLKIDHANKIFIYFIALLWYILLLKSTSAYIIIIVNSRMVIIINNAI